MSIYYVDQRRLIINFKLEYKLQWNSNQNRTIFIQFQRQRLGLFCKLSEICDIKNYFDHDTVINLIHHSHGNIEVASVTCQYVNNKEKMKSPSEWPFVRDQRQIDSPHKGSQTFRNLWYQKLFRSRYSDQLNTSQPWKYWGCFCDLSICKQQRKHEIPEWMALCERPTTDRFSSQRVTNAENLSMSWRHHTYIVDNGFKTKIHDRRRIKFGWMFMKSYFYLNLYHNEYSSE